MYVKYLTQSLSFLAHLKSKRARKESCLVIILVQVSPGRDAEIRVQVQVVCLGNSGDTSTEVGTWYKEKGDRDGHLLLEEFNTVEILRNSEKICHTTTHLELREL